MPRRRQSRRAFTLIELLVGIAIIVLLPMILMAPLSNAWKMSRSFFCLSNRRPLSHEWHLHADADSDVLIPGHAVFRSTNGP